MKVKFSAYMGGAHIFQGLEGVTVGADVAAQHPVTVDGVDDCYWEDGVLFLQCDKFDLMIPTVLLASAVVLEKGEDD